jgi:hypothetical protein
MRSPLCALIVALMPAAGIAFERPSGMLTRCSIGLAPGSLSSKETVLLATGASDTILVGQGSTRPSTEGGHAGTGAPGPIYGQVFNVARFTGANAVLLSDVFHERGDSHAVIVPWDYDSGCRPSRWTRGFAWVPGGRPGTFTVRLRPDSLWVNGMPVFDAFLADFEPYPLSPMYRDDHIRPTFRSSTWLTAEQYYELLEVLPTQQEREARPDSTWHVFLHWRDANSDLSQAYPANQIRVDLANQISRIKATQLLRSIRPVVAGTYRMSLSLAGIPERTFYLRTWPHATSEWYETLTPPRLPGPLDEPRRPHAFLVLARGASAQDALQTDCRESRLAAREGYIHVIDPPTAVGEERTEWRGWLDVRLLAAQFPEDSALVRFSRQAFEESMRRWSDNLGRQTPARFWLDADSVLLVEQITRLESGETLTIRGARISSVVIACDW